MTANEVLLPRDMPPVPALDECRVLVPQIVRDDLKGIAISQSLHRVGVPPVVERGVRELDRGGRCLVSTEGGVLTDSREDRSVVRHRPDVLGKDFPRPRLGSADDAVPPGGLSASRVDRPFLQVDVPSHEAFDDLPLNARGGHESLDRAVRHGQRVNERLRLHTVQPARFHGIRGGSLDITGDVSGDDVLPTEPLTKGRKSGVVSVLRGSRALKPVQKGSDPGLREVGSGEQCPPGDQASHLDLVFGGLRRPLIYERGEIGGRERGKELIERAGFEGIVDLPEFRPLLVHSGDRSPIALIPEGLDHALDIFGNVRIGRPARKDPRPSVVQSDTSAEPIRSLGLVRHGRNDGIAATPSATFDGEVT